MPRKKESTYHLCNYLQLAADSEWGFKVLDLVQYRRTLARTKWKITKTYSKFCCQLYSPTFTRPSIDWFNRFNDSTVYAVRCQWTDGSRSIGVAKHQLSNRMPPHGCTSVHAYHVYRISTLLSRESLISGIHHLLVSLSTMCGVLVSKPLLTTSKEITAARMFSEMAGSIFFNRISLDRSCTRVVSLDY